MKRAIRRHHRDRLKKSRKDYWWWPSEGEKNPYQLGVLVNNPCVCSCIMCCNARNVRGRDNRSPKEREFELIFEEQYLDYLSDKKQQHEANYG